MTLTLSGASHPVDAGLTAPVSPAFIPGLSGVIYHVWILHSIFSVRVTITRRSDEGYATMHYNSRCGAYQSAWDHLVPTRPHPHYIDRSFHPESVSRACEEC